MSDTETQDCAEPDCTNQRPTHRWGRIKSGWFEQQDGTAWCPEHTPAWVAAWRAKRGESR